jgi:hypothetical protein
LVKLSEIQKVAAANNGIAFSIDSWWDQTAIDQAAKDYPSGMKPLLLFMADYNTIEPNLSFPSYNALYTCVDS